MVEELRILSSLEHIWHLAMFPNLLKYFQTTLFCRFKVVFLSARWLVFSVSKYAKQKVIDVIQFIILLCYVCDMSNVQTGMRFASLE